MRRALPVVLAALTLGLASEASTQTQRRPAPARPPAGDEPRSRPEAEPAPDSARQQPAPVPYRRALQPDVQMERMLDVEREHGGPPPQGPPPWNRPAEGGGYPGPGYGYGSPGYGYPGYGPPGYGPPEYGYPGYGVGTPCVALDRRVTYRVPFEGVYEEGALAEIYRAPSRSGTTSLPEHRERMRALADYQIMADIAAQRLGVRPELYQGRAVYAPPAHCGPYPYATPYREHAPYPVDPGYRPYPPDAPHRPAPRPPAYRREPPR